MKRKIISFKDIKTFVEAKDGELLGEDSNGKKERKITIKCNKDGHIWTTSLSNVMNIGTWCMKCYRKSRIKLVDKKEILNFLDKVNLKLLTEGKINFWSKIKVRCDKHNHEWHTSYVEFERG